MQNMQSPLLLIPVVYFAIPSLLKWYLRKSTCSGFAKQQVSGIQRQIHAEIIPTNNFWTFLYQKHDLYQFSN